MLLCMYEDPPFLPTSVPRLHTEPCSWRDRNTPWAGVTHRCGVSLPLLEAEVTTGSQPPLPRPKRGAAPDPRPPPAFWGAAGPPPQPPSGAPAPCALVLSAPVLGCAGLRWPQGQGGLDPTSDSWPLGGNTGRPGGPGFLPALWDRRVGIGETGRALEISPNKAHPPHLTEGETEAGVIAWRPRDPPGAGCCRRCHCCYPAGSDASACSSGASLHPEAPLHSWSHEEVDPMSL